MCRNTVMPEVMKRREAYTDHEMVMVEFQLSRRIVRQSAPRGWPRLLADWRFYQIKWKGYPAQPAGDGSAQYDWEPEWHLRKCKKSINKYWTAQHNKSRALPNHLKVKGENNKNKNKHKATISKSNNEINNQQEQQQEHRQSVEGN